jgi:hypothetical protein
MTMPARIPCRDSGSVTRRNVVTCPAPRSLAASSVEEGIRSRTANNGRIMYGT